MTWLDKLLRKQRDVERVRSGSSSRTEQRKNKDERKSRPCIVTDVLAKARCEDDKHAEE